MNNQKDNKDQPPVYDANYISVTTAQSTPLYQPTQPNQPTINTDISISFEHNHQSYPPQPAYQQPAYQQQTYQVQHVPQHPHAQQHYNNNVPSVASMNYNHRNYRHTPSSDCNKYGAGLTLSTSALSILTSFPKYSNTHPVYSTMPLDYHNPDVLPDISILPQETAEIYYNPENSKYNQRTNAVPAILDNVKYIEREPFRRPSCCAVLSIMSRINRALIILSLVISICFGVFIGRFASYSQMNDFPYHIFLGMFGLFLYMIYILFFMCLKSRMSKFKKSDIVALQDKFVITDYSVISNAVVSPLSYIYPPDVDLYINNLQHNAGPRLYLNILALEKSTIENSVSWSTTYHALRPVPIHAWKDISISSHDFLQNLEESGDNFFKVKYQYEYYLTPGQQKLLELMTLQCQREESWRGELVCVFVTYNTDLQESEKVEASPFARKVYNSTSGMDSMDSRDHRLPSHSSVFNSTSTATPVPPTDTSYLNMDTPSYQTQSTAYNNNSSDKLISYDTQVQTHHVLAYKEKRCCNIIRTLLFNPFLEWFFIITVAFNFIYAFIYRYSIADYTYYNRKFLSISSKTNPSHDVVRLDVMPNWRTRPNDIAVPDV